MTPRPCFSLWTPGSSLPPSTENVRSRSEYYTGYRQSVRKPNEMLRAVRIPLPLAESTAFYKIAKRRFEDISSVSVAIALQMTDGVVASVRIGSAVWQQLLSELSQPNKPLLKSPGRQKL